MKREVITLCGSSKFKNDFYKWARRYTLDGYVVLMPSIFTHAEGMTLDKETKLMLSDIHKQKIAMSDAILVINPGGYIGESTKEEIEYAKQLGKRIQFIKPY